MPLIVTKPTIAITGSAGKTTTKEMIASILETKMKIFKSLYNRNQRHHTRKYAKRIKPWHEAIVLEFAMGRKKAGKTHCSYIQPNISIITNVGAAHFGMLGNSIEKTAESKSDLIKYMNPTGTLLLNNDDRNSKLLQTDGFNGKMVTVGIQTPSDFQASEIRYMETGMSFNVQINGKDENLFLPAFGDHNVINSLFAIAVAHQLGFTPLEIRQGLQNYVNPARRLDIYRMQDNCLLIDDSFSSNPQAAKAAIDVLVKLGEGRNKIVVMGSMLELGLYTSEGHKEVGRYLEKNKVDHIFTIGSRAKLIGDGAIEAGFLASRVFHLEDRANLHEWLERYIKPNTVILVKGSNRTRMDLTVDYLKEKYKNPLI